MTASEAGRGRDPGTPPPERPRHSRSYYIRWYLTVPLFAALLTVFLASLIAGRQPPDVYESLETMQTGRPRARWRAAGALATALSNPARVPQDDKFSAQLLDLFNNRALQDIDRRIHLYLALALGRVGDARFCDPLLRALQASEPGTEARAVYVRALGLLRDPRAVPELLPLLASDDTTVRHEAVQALGAIGDTQARDGLRTMLTDREANVQWDAAVSLAKMGDPAGKDVLLRLLDRAYYAQFPDVRQAGCDWAMETAVRTGVQLNDDDINHRIREIAASDPNLRVRGVALEMVEVYGLGG